VKTGIITTDTYLDHDTGQGHPERADRVTIVIDHLKKVKSKNLIWKKPAKFDLKYLEFAHDKNYLNNVKDSFPKQGLNFLDGDTIVSPGSKEATRDAVGSILTAIDGVMKMISIMPFVRLGLQVIMLRSKKLWDSVFIIISQLELIIYWKNIN